MNGIGAGRRGLRLCPSCWRLVRVTVTENARRLPVEPEPDPQGNVAAYLDTSDTWRSRVLQKGEEPMHIEKRFMPHYAKSPGCRPEPRTTTGPAPRRRLTFRRFR